MSDSDKILKLLIEMGVAGKEDVQAANELLAETGRSVGDLSKEMGVINVTAQDVEKALANVGQSAHESGGHVEGHALKSRDLHKVMHALNGLVPGLGNVLKLAFHPESIGIIGCLVAFEGLKSVLESIKALDEIKLADFAGLVC